MGSVRDGQPPARIERKSYLDGSILGCPMERARATWTDERLDDLSRRVDVGFERVDGRFDHVDRRFDHMDTEMRALRTELGARIDVQGARIDALQRTMLQVGAGVIGSILLGIVTLIATQG